MSRLRRAAGYEVTSEAVDRRFTRGACFLAGPVVLVLAIVAVTRLAATPGEVLLGVLGGLTLSLLLVVLATTLAAGGREPEI